MKATQVICSLTQKQYNVKKVCKLKDMPLSCSFFASVLNTNNMWQDIYRTDSGVLYAGHERN
jgi:hypothetical protein